MKDTVQNGKAIGSGGLGRLSFPSCLAFAVQWTFKMHQALLR